MEKCYRDIQTRGQIAGLNMLELFILIAIPILLFPVFTLLNINFGIILIIEILLFVIFRLAAKVSPFDYGFVSFVYSKFIWPQRLSAFVLDEKKYLKDESEAGKLKSQEKVSSL
jgi:uncharacterized membrane protein